MNIDLKYISQFKSVIEDIVDKEIKNAGITKYISAIVQKINDDGTVDVYLPPDKNNLITGIFNRCGELLFVGDSVEIATKNGSLTNAWVFVKHGTNISGYSNEVEELGASVVLKVSNGRLVTTTLTRSASLGNSITILADDINLDGYNINLNGSRGITITSPYFNVTKTGVITATSGTIGGWTMGATRLSSGSGNNYVGLDSGTQNVNYAIWAGNETPANAPFSVTRAGAVTASNVNITGGTLSIGSNFSVTNTGVLNASSATINGILTAGAGSSIGGWTATATRLYSGSGSTYMSLDTNPNVVNGIWIGNSSAGSAPFRVHKDGTLIATNATIKGDITATSGEIGGCSISNGTLQIANANIGSLSVDKITAGSNSNALTFTNITANGGKVGGWTINSTTISQTKGNYTVTIANYNNDNAGSRVFYCTDNTTGNDTFYVHRDGKLYASNAEITGTIYATSGSFKGSISSGSTISGSSIVGGTININNEFSVNSNGEMQMSKSGGFLSFRHSNHPFVSALNCAVSSGGIILVAENNQDDTPNTQLAKISGGLNSDNSRYGVLSLGTWYCGSYGEGWQIATKTGGYPSTRNLKTNLQNIDNEYDDIYNELKNINMYTYEYKYDGIKKDKHDYGFVIDEFDESKHLSKYVLNYDRYGKIVDNELVKYTKGQDAEDYNPKKDGYNFKYKDWDRDSYFKMSLILIKSLQHKIDELEKKINKL